MMRILGIVPARYNSSRLPGKPLVDICGKPMIWWVYQQAKKERRFFDVLVATDDERIMNVCEKLGMRAIMTSPDGTCLIDRLHEVSEKIKSDFYVSINGDEPLIESENIHHVFPSEPSDAPIVRGVYRLFTDPVEVIDSANMKIVCNENGRLIFLSRSPIPYPHKTAEFAYKKYVGIECYNKAALDFYMGTPPGPIEKIEDLGTLRFLEHGVDVYFSEIKSNSLSVDTLRDLEKVRHIMAKRTAHEVMMEKTR